MEEEYTRRVEDKVLSQMRVRYLQITLITQRKSVSLLIHSFIH